MSDSKQAGERIHPMEEQIIKSFDAWADTRYPLADKVDEPVPGRRVYRHGERNSTYLHYRHGYLQAKAAVSVDIPPEAGDALKRLADVLALQDQAQAAADRAKDDMDAATAAVSFAMSALADRIRERRSFWDSAKDTHCPADPQFAQSPVPTEEQLKGLLGADCQNESRPYLASTEKILAGLEAALALINELSTVCRHEGVSQVVPESLLQHFEATTLVQALFARHEARLYEAEKKGKK